MNNQPLTPTFENHISRIVAIRSLWSVSDKTREQIAIAVDDAIDFIFYEALFAASYSYFDGYTRFVDGAEVKLGCFIDSGETYWIIGDAPIQDEEGAKILLSAFLAQGQ